MRTYRLRSSDQMDLSMCRDRTVALVHRLQLSSFHFMPPHTVVRKRLQRARAASKNVSIDPNIQPSAESRDSRRTEAM